MTRALIEKLEAAEGPSRELDAMVRAVLFGDFVHCDANMLSTCYNYPDCSDWDGCGEPIGMSDERKSYPSDWRDDERLPAYTSSLDASLALLERVLPKWVGEISTIGCATIARPGIKRPAFHGDADTPALALLIAIVEALDAMEQNDE